MKKLFNSLSLLLGIVLLFSGFIKAIDPIGMQYKIEEYFGTFGTFGELIFPLALPFSVFLILVEILLGWMLVCRVFLKKTFIWATILFVFFGFLTFYSAYTQSITDCGCFGDFIKLEPWTSFFKDLVFLFVTLLLWFIYSKIGSTKFLSLRSFMIFQSIGILLICYTLIFIPIIDFRPYKVGVSISKATEIPPDAPKDEIETEWIYKVGTDTLVFSSDQKPWNIEGSVYIDRNQKLIKKGYRPPIEDFNLFDYKGDEVDLTAFFAKKKLWITILKNIDSQKLQSILSLYERSKEKVYILSTQSIESLQLEESIWKDRYIFVDSKLLKTMIRASIGYFCVDNGVIVDKWTSDRNCLN